MSLSLALRALSTVLFVSSILPGFAQAQQESPVSPEKPIASAPQTPPPMDMSLVAPLVVESSDWASVLTLVSNSASDLPVVLILRDREGHSIASLNRAIPASGSSMVDLNQLLKSNSHTSAQHFLGSLIVTSSSPNFVSLAAQLSMSGKNGLSSLHIEEELVMLQNHATAFAATMAGSTGNVALSLTSLGTHPQTVTTRCLSDRSSSVTTSVWLQPSQSVMVSPCDRNPTRTAADDLLGFSLPNVSQSSTNRAVGISVSTTGIPGELAVFGVGQTVNGSQTQLSSLNFHQTALARSSIAIFAGVPVGTTGLLGGLTFQPEAAVTNFSGLPISVTVGFSTVSGGHPFTTKILHDTLAPYSSKTLTMPPLLGDESLKNSFTLSSDAPPGQFYSDVYSSSVEQLGFRVDGISKDQNQLENGGEHPWRADENFDSALLLFNPSEDEVAHVSISFNGRLASHEAQISLKPGENRNFRLSEVFQIDNTNRQPGLALNDKGTVFWSSSGPDAVVGRVLEFNTQERFARNFSCGTKTVLCGVTIDSNPLQLTVGGTASTFGHYKGCSVLTSSNSCSGSASQSAASASAWAWTVANSSIASIQGSAVTGTGTFRGNAGGTTTMGLSAVDRYGCTGAGSGSIVVGTGCPTSITLAEPLSPIYLANYFPTDKTGEGAAAAMQANPTSTNFSGAAIKEDVGGVSSSCNSASLISCGSQASLFIVNTPGTYKNVTYTPVNSNSFWDFHYRYDSSSLLDGTAPVQQSCQTTCSQTYACNGSVIGRFTIVKSYTRGTISGQNVTNVSVTKQ